MVTFWCDTTGLCQGVGHYFGWDAPVECFAWLVVVNVGDHLQVLGAVDGQVAVLGRFLLSLPLVYSLLPRSHGDSGWQK